MRLKLEVGKPVFSIMFSWLDKAIILSWCAETSVANIVWIQLVTIKWRCPPVKMIDCFTEKY